MKKYIIQMAAAAFALMGLSACDVETNEKPGGTEVEQMAGFWDVRVHEVNADGTLTQNAFGGSTYNLQTYNTVENTADKMWVNVSVGKKWSLLLVTPINYGAHLCLSKCESRVQQRRCRGNSEHYRWKGARRAGAQPAQPAHRQHCV